ncbi:MAG: ABC transporter permease [Planctomycetota bacterium]
MTTRVWRDVSRFPLTILRCREIIQALVARELKARYRGSLIGGLWQIAMPLALLGVYYMIFVEILGVGIGQEQAQKRGLQPGPYSAFYILCGVLPYLALSESMMRSCGIIFENANLIKKIYFPSELLPVYIVLVTLVTQLIGTALIVGAVCFTSDGFPGVTYWTRLPLYFVVLVFQVLFTSGLTLFFASANVFLRDTQPIVNVLMMFLMFLTPIFYSLDRIDGLSAETRALFQLNPLYHLIEAYRWILIHPERSGAPWGEIGIFAPVAVVVFGAGLVFFSFSKSKFADEI